MRLLLSTIILFAASAALVRADDWPAWRGPTGQGYCAEKNLPVKWSGKDNVNIKWRIKLAHPGYSTPIVWKDKIFLTMANEGGKVRSLYCLDRADGKQLWKADVEHAAKEQTWANYPYCHASPVTDGERVVVSFGSAGMHCYDLDGKPLWKRIDLGVWQHQFGNSSSPVLHEDLCYMWCGPNAGKGRNFLLAVDKKTGKTVWEHNEKTGSWGTPIITKIDGLENLVLGMGAHLKGFDPKTGKELWLCEGLTSYVYTSPVVSNGYAIAMSGYGGAGIGIKLGGSGNITKDGQLWRHPSNAQRVGSGIIIGEHVYIMEDPGTPKCFELATGKEVWLVKERPSTRNWGSMVHADGKLYVMDRDARTFIFAASPKYELLAANNLGKGESTNSSVVISNGEIFLRTSQSLWCISDKK